MRWLATLALAVALAPARELPCKFVTSKPEWGAYAVCPVDVDGDSADELYTVMNVSEWVERSPENFVWYGRSPYPHGLECAAWSADLGEPNGRSVVVAEVERESTWLRVMDALSGKPWRVLARADNHPGCEGWDSYAGGAAFADLDGDGARDIVFEMRSGYRCPFHPRELLALSGADGRLLWRYRLGPAPKHAHAEDVDGDGRPEVFVGGIAPGNVKDTFSLADSTSLVVCLDERGQERWMRQFRHGHGSCTWVALARAGHGRQPVLVVGDHASYDTDPADSLHLLDCATGSSLRSTPTGRIPTRSYVFDLNGDGVDEIVTAEENELVVRDLGLRVLARRSCGSTVRMLLCGRLLGGKAGEIAVSVGGSVLQVLDRRLVTLAEFDLRGPRIDEGRCLMRRRGPGRPTALVARVGDDYLPVETDAAPAGRYIELQLVVLPRPFPWVWVSAGLAALLLVAAGAFVGLRRGYREQVATLSRGLAGRAGVVVVGRHGRVTSINDAAKRMLGGGDARHVAALLAAPELLPVREAFGRVAGGREKQTTAEFVRAANGKPRTWFVRVSRLAMGGALIGIEDESAAEYARRAVEWVPVAQKLAHDIKNPLTAMSLTLQRVERASGEEAGRHVASMREDIDRLKKMADGFMRLTQLEPPRPVPTDLNEVAGQCLAKFREAAPAGVTLDARLESGLPLVALDREQFVSACANVVENALAATAGRGGRVTVSTRRDGDAVVLAVADTGPGIPARYLTKVFEPYFTLKPGGTGLGMCLTKRIVEDHKGTITVASTEGAGTTVTIRLPAGTQSA